ncbi:MAG: lactate utilization protein [Spirochaetaceae bacterium]|nr:lactate utilization protein [Spirochaetaceae bacterium]
MSVFDVVKKNLENRGFSVSCFKTAAEAVEHMNSQIDGKTVGMGGSMTLDAIGIYEKLASHNEVFWHQRTPEGKTPNEIKAAANGADVYLSSINGLAETGEIVNIDGNCNRIAAILYGHEKVYLVAGQNKLAKDYEAALWRARNIAAPLNTKRLGRKTPCAVKADKCYDCRSPERICSALSVLWTRPTACDYEIILIEENLGF